MNKSTLGKAVIFTDMQVQPDPGFSASWWMQRIFNRAGETSIGGDWTESIWKLEQLISDMAEPLNS